MPKVSIRQQVLAAAFEKWQKARLKRQARMARGDIRPNVIEESIEGRCKRVCLKSLSTRCVQDRGSHRSRSFDEECKKLLDDGPGCFLKPPEFKANFAMSRDSFWQLHELLKNHPIFTGRQSPVSHQLLVFLAWVRMEGAGMSSNKGRNWFKASVGNIANCKMRVLRAILDCCCEDAVFWPDETERKEISKEFHKQFQWKDCVGVVDGTLFPLAFTPSREDCTD